MEKKEIKGVKIKKKEIKGVKMEKKGVKLEKKMGIFFFFI